MADVRQRDGLVIGAAVAVLVLVISVVVRSAIGLVVAVWVLPVVAAAWEDAWTARLRDVIVLPGVVATGLVVLVVGVPRADGDLMVGAGLGAALLGVTFLLVHLVAPAGLGFGDVKYAALLGLGIGAINVAALVLSMALAAVVQFVVARTRFLPAQRDVRASSGVAPYGPALAAGALIAVAVSLAVG